MGYYTRFKAKVSGPESVMDAFTEDADIEDDAWGKFGPALDFWFDAAAWDSMKWYEWAEDMENLSKEYPNLLFELEGEGEDSGDIWKAWARNGKVVTARAVVTFPTPDLDNELPLDLDFEAKFAQEQAQKARVRAEEEARRAERRKVEAEEAVARAQAEAENALRNLENAKRRLPS